MIDSLIRIIIDFGTRLTVERGSLVPGKTTFQKLFRAFEPCIRGFAYCKLIVQVDET